jgi:hypothetical protein
MILLYNKATPKKLIHHPKLVLGRNKNSQVKISGERLHVDQWNLKTIRKKKDVSD